MATLFSLLMKQDFGDLEAAATAWRSLAAKADTDQQTHRRQVSGPLHASGWSGSAAESAIPQLELNETDLGLIAVEAQAISTTLTSVKSQMESCQSELRRAVREAEAAGHQVSDDGVVTPPKLDPAWRNDPDYQEVQRNNGNSARGFQERITTAVNNAQKASNDGASALAQLRGDILTSPRPSNGPSKLAEATADAKLVKDKFALFPCLSDSASPADNKKWWDSLSPEMQRQYLLLDPDTLANRDGIPTHVRDMANRHILERELDKMYNVGYPNKDKMDADEWKLREEGLRELSGRLNKSDGAPPGHEMYLIGLDPKGDGRAIVSIGNPDTAKNTAVCVPGSETDLSNISDEGNDLDRAQRLVQSSDRYGNRGDTAAIMWLGYDTPDSAYTNAPADHYAEEGAPKLDRYIDSLGATHDGGPRHTSVIGHSYGTVVMGEAAKNGNGLAVDDIVTLGSPGMHVRYAKDLNIDPEHVWAAEASEDKVPDVGSIGHGEGGWFDHPNVPTSPEFGANIIRSGTAKEHSDYWNMDGPGVPNEALDNQARIVTGNYDKVTTH
ncbi:alpha/beta hydrolase [Kitasatospora sp. NPDC054939]